MAIKMWLLLIMTLFIVVVVFLMLHWLNIITLTDVFTSERNLSKLVITALDDPKISLALTLTITVFFIFSNSLTTSLLVVVSAVFSLHWLNIVTLPGFFPSALDDPKISGAVTVSIIVSLTLTTSLTTIILAAVNVVLWFNWLKIITLTAVFTSERNFSELTFTALDDPKLSGVLALTVTVFFIMSNSLTTSLLVVVSAVFSLHWLNIITLAGFFPSALDDPKISEVMTVTILVFFTLSNPMTTTVLAAVNVVLWFNWLEIISLKDVFTSEINLSEFVFTVLDDPKMSGVLTPAITVFFMSNSWVITLSLTVSVIFSLHRFNIITLTHFFPSWLKNPKISGVFMVTIAVLLTMSTSLITTLSVVVNVTLWSNWLEIITLTDVFTSGRNLLKLVILALDDPKISGVLTLTVSVFFFMSNVLVITISVIVSLVFSLHRFNIITLKHIFPSRLKNPKILGVLIVTVTVFLTFSTSLITTLSVAVNVTLWFNSLDIITVSDLVTLGSDVFVSFTSGSSYSKTCTESSPGAKRLADVVKGKSTLITSQTGHVPIYRLPLEEKQTNINGCKSFTFGEKSMNCNRNIMVLGAAGAGKSTVINAMMNYVLGVRWEDSFRFKLVDEGQSDSQVHSQTSEITVYKLYHQEGFRVNYSLTIIDTPGFGGTGGVDRDKEITEQLRNLFANQEGVGDIDAVCFVVQAGLTELTSTQRYVFDSALSIFGKDVAENIRILVTFADEQQQPVVEAIKVSGVPCPKGADGLPVHFKFNNSVLFANNKSSLVRRMIWPYKEKTFEYWNMGTNNIAGFFASLANIKTIRLTMTIEVQKERQQLESTVEELQKQVKLNLAKLEDIRETNDKLKEHEAEIRKNEDFVFHITGRKNRQIDISHTRHYITNCMQCCVTCHYPCSIPNDDGKRGCAAMGQGGYCQVCPGKCFWNVHSNQSFRWEYSQVDEAQTVKQLKEKYEKACGQKLTLEQLMKNLMSEYRSMQDDVVKLIAEAAKCLNRMKEIVLNPNPLTTPEYIDLLIKGEEQEAKPGWKERVQSLMKLKEKAEIIDRVEKEVLGHQ
ncbi:uncharacterized protein LOC106940256 [Poecilia latipinna]|uniref:uncharacterized protein LOC106940256 n=1 Tax=Poecilia latipinna TaxID=48699 RepID=UPI00072DB7F9|nr:PREDICTED: uncharacterized protein LOC106940256 [Poecilia latipinna]